jgi:hypothetical protein
MNAGAAAQTPKSWKRALDQHDAAMAAFIDAISAIPDDRWPVPSAPGKWSPAAEVLHVALSYEVALRGVRTGAGMRPRVSPVRARLLRWLVLPVMLNSSWFPRARAPVEIRPPVDAAADGVDLSPQALRSRLDEAARAVRDELPPAPPGLRFHHAYFGDLAPRLAMRMLAAHTRHHARVLARRFRKVME